MDSSIEPDKPIFASEDPIGTPVGSSIAPEPDKPIFASKSQLGASQSALLPWKLTVSASATSVWPTQAVTVTMTANQDVLPTPFYMTIWESIGNTAIIANICDRGTSCSATRASPVPAFVSYFAELTDKLGNEDNPSLTQVIHVDWKSSQLALSASPTTLPVGANTTLTTHTVDISMSPFWTEVYDFTAGTLLNECGWGTVCPSSVSQSVPTTRGFRASFGKHSTLPPVIPPAGIVEYTPVNYVTWTSSGYSLNLNVAGSNVTATASIDVGPTPYWIQIFDLNTGTRVGRCGWGTTCSVSGEGFPPNCHAFAAFISADDATLTPHDIQASSNTVISCTEPPH
jgi:hypothetical protein